MRKCIIVCFSTLFLFGCRVSDKEQEESNLESRIAQNSDVEFVKNRARQVLSTGFNAGDGYREVWIRDYNTFIELSAEVFDKEELKENLLVFFQMQGEDGNILDGFTPRKEVGEQEEDFIYTDNAPGYAGHKNTVETDQETSLVQTVYKYIAVTGDTSILSLDVNGKTVAERLEFAMEYLMQERFNEEYGLLWGATTADWGDIQPEEGRGIDMDENTHPAIDIYDNAMFIIALDNLMEILPDTEGRWKEVRNGIFENSRKHLWDEDRNKFLTHIYLEKGSPFPADFDEEEIYYFGGTAIAIEAGLLSKDEVYTSLKEMKKRVKLAGAPSIGLTIYPTYPKGYFYHPGMNPEYTYQNGGDWTWFGGRMIQQLVRFGFLEEAYEELQPMLSRVKENNGFYEWYSVDNKPRGSGTFRGSAGVLFKAIEMLEKEVADK